MNRDFKGIWIPKEIWLSEELSLQEKVFLVEINSLDNEDGCFANNEYFSKFFGLSKVRVSEVIGSLIKKGFVKSEIDQEKGNKRILNTLINLPLIPSQRKVEDPIKEKFATPHKESFKHSNTIINNTDNNTISISDKKSLFGKMTDIYNTFCIEKINVPGKFGAKEGKALKSIIKYLQSSIRNKEGGEDAIADAWQFVLKNVDKWDRFHQGQLTLNQIDSNLINILNSIRNGNKKPNGVIQANSHAEFVANILNDPAFKNRATVGGVDEGKHLQAKQL